MPPRRRALLGAMLGAGSLGLKPRAPLAGPEPLPEAASLLVAGGSGGRLDRLAGALLPALGRALPGGPPRRLLAGAEDGVTGANRYEADTTPDGATALLLPGAALLSWLVGDRRARFDALRLVPALAAVTPAVLVRRAGQRRGARLRAAAPRPDAPELAGLMALDLLRLPFEPVWTQGEPDAALRAGAADAALVAGADVPARVRALAASGFEAMLALGPAGPDGAAPRDPAYPELPTLPELLDPATPAGLLAGWRACAVGAQLCALLALLSPSPAALVALWRRAAAEAAAQPGAGAEPAARLLACPAANQFVSPLAADPAAPRAVRLWLADRLQWQPA